MSSSSGAREAHGFRKGAHYPAFRRLFLLILLLPLGLTEAKAQLPERTYWSLGPAVLPGAGLVASRIEVGRFVTREVWLGTSYRASRDGSVRVMGTVGGAIRLLGARNTVLQGTPGRFDLDVGGRIGPSILFRFEETAIDKNKRFTLAADPFVRATITGPAIISLEAGIHRPAFRLGFWLSF